VVLGQAPPPRQVLIDPSRFPLWVSAVLPGAAHDLTAARQ